MLNYWMLVYGQPHMDPELQYHKEICEILEETGTDLPVSILNTLCISVLSIRHMIMYLGLLFF